MRSQRTEAYSSIAIAILAGVALAGCSVARRQPAHPRGAGPGTAIPSGSNVPAPPPDVLSIPDAVPRMEPRGTRGNPPIYEVFGKRYYVMASADGWVERGIASWYGPGFHGASTSLGEPYDMYGMTAAHKTLPIPCYAEVTNTRNGRKVIVRINDRGPFVGDRIIDLSYTAAAKLDMLLAGTAPVEVRVITPGRDAPGSAMPPVLPSAAAAPALPPKSAPCCTPAAAPPPVRVVNAPAVPKGRGTYLQAGVFADHENARRRVEQLLAAGFELASLEEIPRNDQALHRVRVGPFGSVEELDLNLKRLHELGISDAHVATE